MCADTYINIHMRIQTYIYMHTIVPAAVAALPLAVDDLEGHVLVGWACDGGGLVFGWGVDKDKLQFLGGFVGMARQ